MAGRTFARRPTSAIGSLTLVLVCAALFTSLYLRADRQVAVLEVAHDVSQGQPITAADLASVKVSTSPGLSVVPVSAAKGLIGRRARVPLLAGTLLTPTEFASGGGPPPGQVVVGIAVKIGALPAGGVTPGDLVDVIETAPPGVGAMANAGPSGSVGNGFSGAIGTIAQHVVVADVAQPTSANSDVTVVSVIVASAQAAEVANVSAAGQAAIAIVGLGH